jgi:uncharacterized membrane protein HdeD (DUF308 family)
MVSGICIIDHTKTKEMERIKIIKSGELSMARLESKNSIAIGVLLVIIGMFAIMSPVFIGISLTYLVGALLFISGIFEIIYAIKEDSLGKNVLKFIFGGLSIVIGAIIFATPTGSMALISILLIVYFFASGALSIVVSMKQNPAEGWGWILMNGVLSILFGILVIVGWPVTGVWLLGFYVGLKILMHGILFIMLGRTGLGELTHLQDSRIEMLETYAVEGAMLIHELQVRLVEQAALIAALGKELKTKVSSSDVDPAMKELNKDLGEAREWMKDVKTTTMESWDELQKESKEELDKLKKKADGITKNLKKALGLDKA